MDLVRSTLNTATPFNPNLLRDDPTVEKPAPPPEPPAPNPEDTDPFLKYAVVSPRPLLARPRRRTHPAPCAATPTNASGL